MEDDDDDDGAKLANVPRMANSGDKKLALEEGQRGEK